MFHLATSSPQEDVSSVSTKHMVRKEIFTNRSIQASNKSEERVRALQNNVDELNTSLNYRGTELEKKELLVEELEGKVSNYKSKIEQLTQNLKNAETRKNQNETTIEETTQEMQGLRNQLETFSLEVENTQQKLAALEKIVSFIAAIPTTYYSVVSCYVEEMILLVLSDKLGSNLSVQDVQIMLGLLSFVPFYMAIHKVIERLSEREGFSLLTDFAGKLINGFLTLAKYTAIAGGVSLMLGGTAAGVAYGLDYFMNELDAFTTLIGCADAILDQLIALGNILIENFHRLVKLIQN